MLRTPTVAADIESRCHIINYMRDNFDSWLEFANTSHSSCRSSCIARGDWYPQGASPGPTVPQVDFRTVRHPGQSHAPINVPRHLPYPLTTFPRPPTPLPLALPLAPASMRPLHRSSLPPISLAPDPHPSCRAREIYNTGARCTLNQPLCHLSLGSRLRWPCIAFYVPPVDAVSAGLIQWHLLSACRFLSAPLPRSLPSAGSRCRAPSTTHLGPVDTSKPPLPTNPVAHELTIACNIDILYFPLVSRRPPTPGSAGSHARKPSKFGAVEQFKLNRLEGDVSRRRNSMPS